MSATSASASTFQHRPSCNYLNKKSDLMLMRRATASV